jgi:hypothetical protein
MDALEGKELAEDELSMTATESKNCRDIICSTYLRIKIRRRLTRLSNLGSR